MKDRLDYSMFRDLFRIMDVNPSDFFALLGREHLIGYWPDLPDREPKINIYKLADVLKEGFDE